jgi:diguanylate cyclase (GGDEF)-like protein
LCTVTALLILSAERTDRLIAQLERHAAIDPLTGLATRRVLDSAASSALQGAANDGGTALLLIDLDHFKRINDVHGHPAGDYALQQLAKLLRGVNRTSDLISRMGGDEIAVLMPGCSLPAALRRAEQILLEVRASRIDVGHCSMAMEADIAKELSISVSIGVAHMPTHAAEVHALYAAADASLYNAKRAGRDRVGEAAAGRRVAA